MAVDSYDKILVSRDSNGAGGSLGSATLSELRGWNGWGDYADREYTEGSPFQPATTVWTDLPNNAVGGPRAYEPDIGTLFSGNKILGRTGDSLVLTIEMTAKPTTAAVTYLDLAIDIGGAIGRIYPQNIAFPKGQNVARPFSFSFGVYTLDTWEANGGQIVVNPSAAMDIYGIRTVVIRTSAP